MKRVAKEAIVVMREPIKVQQKDVYVKEAKGILDLKDPYCQKEKWTTKEVRSITRPLLNFTLKSFIKILPFNSSKKVHDF